MSKSIDWKAATLRAASLTAYQVKGMSDLLFNNSVAGMLLNAPSSGGLACAEARRAAEDRLRAEGVRFVLAFCEEVEDDGYINKWTYWRFQWPSADAEDDSCFVEAHWADTPDEAARSLGEGSVQRGWDRFHAYP